NSETCLRISGSHAIVHLGVWSIGGYSCGIRMSNAFPEWVEPMAATLTQDRFTGPEWVFERKFDGIRLLAFKHRREVRLLSRNRLPQNASYPSIADAVAALPPHDMILDGEAT